MAIIHPNSNGVNSHRLFAAGRPRRKRGRRTAQKALALAAASAALFAGAATVKPVRAVRAANIHIDGRIQEKGWTAGPWFTGFTLAGTHGKPAAVQTRFAVRFDDSALYLAAVMDEPNPKALRAAVTRRDGPVFRDDCIEFMVDPVGDRVEYYHFIVNSRGTVYDAQHRQGGHVSTALWNCDARAAARVEKAAWSVELRIPLAELGLNQRSAKQPWAIQVGRERHAGGRLELSSYVPCGGSFHVPETYAPLILEHAALAPFLWTIRFPVDGMVLAENGRLYYRFRALVENHTGRFHFLDLHADLSRGGRTAGAGRAVGGLDRDQHGTYPFSIPFPENGSYLLRLRLADRRAPGLLLAGRSLPLDLHYTPVSIEVLRPGYRQTIYATQKIHEIIARVHIHLPEKQLRGAILQARLQPAGTAAGKSLAATPEIPAGDGNAEIRLPIPRLGDGKYDLAVAVRTAGGNVFSAHAEIRKVPPARNEWRIDEHRVLLHNGKPFFPYGWFSAPPSEGDKLRAEGVNVIQDYNAEYRSAAAERAWLDQVRTRGLYACFYPWPSSRFMKNFKAPVSPAEEAALRKRIRSLRDHPAIFAWYLWDEPELRPLLVARAKRLYQIIAEEDPYHPCIVLDDSIPGIFKYHACGDILMPDPYPLFNRGGLAGRPIETISRFMRACRRAGRGRKPWWITPQAFNYFNDSGTSRPPNLTELRNQQLQAIINGAHGILWYTYSHRYNYPELDLGIPFLGREARRLERAVLAPDLAGAIDWKAPKPNHIQATVRRVGRELVVFTVNTATVPQDAAFRFTGKTSVPARLFVVSENRAISVRGGQFTDRFETYGGHIYTTSRALAAGPTLAAAQAAIAAAKHRLFRPGNLASAARGTTVTASSIHRYSGRLEMVIDGARKGQGWTDGTWKQWPDWLEVEFKKPETVGRVRVWTRTIGKYEIQLRRGNALATVARGERPPNADSFEAVFSPQAGVRGVRIVADSAAPGGHSSISEVEVYAK